MIIDCHCHATRGDGTATPIITDEQFDRYLRRAEAAGIIGAVLFAAFERDYAVANRQVAEIVAMNPSRFYGFAFVHAQRDKGRIHRMVGEAVETLGLLGIKVHRHDARITREVCDAARKFSIPVLYDLMHEVSILRLLARDYPDVNFIIPHLGSFGDDWNIQRSLIDALVRHPNLYTDTAGVRQFDMIVRAIKLAGAKKVLFGTDGPWLHPKVELEKIRALRLSRTDEELVLCGNLLRLLKRPWTTRSNVESCLPPSLAGNILVDLIPPSPFSRGEGSEDLYPPSSLLLD